jgi:hypothetical protein
MESMQQKLEPSTKSLGWTAGLGLGTILILVCLGAFAPVVGCSDVSLSPVIAFQAARSAQDLINIFGSAVSDCRTSIVEDLMTGNQVDLFAFIPVYAAFLWLIILAFRDRRTTATFFIIMALVVTVVGDVAETAAQIFILNDVGSGVDYLAMLAVGNGVKTVGLSLYLGGTAFVLWQNKTLLARTISVLLVVLAALRLAGYMLNELRPLAPLSALGAFVILAAYTGLRFVSVRRAVVV